MFQTEASLVDCALGHLANASGPFGACETAVEFGHLGGRADILAKAPDGTLLAFEAKLVKWRKALHQAYKNSSFAHCSYVLLPVERCETARAHEDEFRRRGVGLCLDCGDEMVIDIPAKPKPPIRPWLTAAATEFVVESGVSVASMV